METPIVRETRSSVKYADRQIERAHNEAEILEASRRSIIAKQRILAADIAKLETDRDNLAAFLAKEEAAASEAARADTVADEVYDTSAPQEADNAGLGNAAASSEIELRMQCLGYALGRASSKWELKDILDMASQLVAFADPSLDIIRPYKGLSGTVQFEAVDGVYHGRVLGIRDIVTYEAPRKRELQKAFEHSVDYYLNVQQEGQQARSGSAVAGRAYGSADAEFPC